MEGGAVRREQWSPRATLGKSAHLRAIPAPGKTRPVSHQLRAAGKVVPSPAEEAAIKEMHRAAVGSPACPEQHNRGIQGADNG